ncbi:phytoene/squalene synthase family protein [Luteimonas sp. MJ246]|uniref:phytoene/squalene synthase family protein n=1 Tax=Luteimonas sp. MJ174 TaxID=3129237 RepID=UPI0031BB9CEA
MSIDDVRGDAAHFIEKWRARWPEWEIAGVFVPEAQRPRAEAWFSLLQELADAAWGGGDPTPGLAKLAWWQEELGGWAKGARRHPLGALLQPVPAPWLALGRALPDLRALRGDGGDLDDGAIASTAPGAPGAGEGFAAAVADCEAVLFEGRAADADARAVVLASLLGERGLLRAAVDGEPAGTSMPVKGNPGAGSAARSAMRAGNRARGVLAALVAARMARPGRPLPPLRALYTAWRGARRAG